MRDVIPATVNDKKNNTPNNGDIGNSLIICGNTTNARPTPALATLSTGTPMLFAINPRAAKTPIPANNSNPELAKPVINALFVVSEFSVNN